jgi:hypothetical protein
MDHLYHREAREKEKKIFIYEHKLIFYLCVKDN